MDIQRPASVARSRRNRRIAATVVAVTAIAVITLGLSRLKPAAPTVDAATVWIDTVKRGPMVRQVRGLGTLVPEDIRWIPAATDGRVERIVVHPGTRGQRRHGHPRAVEPDADPGRARGRAAAEGRRGAAGEPAGAARRTSASTQEAAAAARRGRARQAKLQAEADARAGEGGLVVGAQREAVAGRGPTNLGVREQIEQKRLAHDTGLDRGAARRAAGRGRPAARAGRRCGAARSASCSVRAGHRRRAAAGAGRGRPAGGARARTSRASPSPRRLKAELQIAETQAKDIVIGQPADDRHAQRHRRRAAWRASTRRSQNGTVHGRRRAGRARCRAGARPDLSVDGTIELERLDDVLYVGRPAFGQEQSASRPVPARAATADAARHAGDSSAAAR